MGIFDRGALKRSFCELFQAQADDTSEASIDQRELERI